MASNKKLNVILSIGGSISSSLSGAFSSTERKINRVGEAVTRATNRQRALGRVIRQMRENGADVDHVTDRYVRLGREVDALRKKQERLNAIQNQKKRFGDAAERINSGSARIAAGGALAGVAAAATLSESKAYSQEEARVNLLGFGREQTRDAIAFTQKLKTYGTSQRENLTLMGDAMSAFGNIDHAKNALPVMAQMRFGNNAVYGAEQGGENEKAFTDMLRVIELRGGTQSEDAFRRQANLVQQVISATRGRVQGSQWSDVIQTGGLAAKSMDDRAFYYQLEPLVQEMGGHTVGTALMSGYASLYQGRTTKRAALNLEKLGLIGDKSKVDFDKAGQVAHLNPGALLGADVFRRSQFEWVTKVLIPQLAKHGITSEAAVLDAIGSINSSRTAANIQGTFYQQRGRIEKAERVNSEAANVDQLNNQAQDTAQGKEAQLRAQRANAELQFGNAMLPTYNKALGTATGLLERFNAYAEKNPASVRRWGIALGSAAVILTGLGAAGFVVGNSMTLLSGVVLPLARFALPLLGVAIRAVTGLMVANPWGAAIAVLATGAVLIYENWGKVKDFFLSLPKILSGPLNYLEGKFSWVSDKIRSIPGIGKVMNDFLPKKDPASDAPDPALPKAALTPAPAPSSASGQQKQPQNVTDSRTYTIHVHQQPGENSQDLANRLHKTLLRDNKTNTLSSMPDGAHAQ